MVTYTVTIGYFEGVTLKTLVVEIKANSQTDAYIMGASKAYAMFAGTECVLTTLSVAAPTP